MSSLMGWDREGGTFGQVSVTGSLVGNIGALCLRILIH